MAKSPRNTYTIPEPERSAFVALATKSGVSEAEHIRRYIRWACKLAGVAIGQENVHTSLPSDSPESHVTQGESPADEVTHGDSGGANGVTSDA